jgi:hypothetical protein
VDPAVIVQGMPLSDSTVVYYFTYGSVLAGLHKEGDNYCIQALEILRLVKAGYSGDPTIMGIVTAGEEICSD